MATIIEGAAAPLTAAFLAHRGYFRLAWVMIGAALSTLPASHSYFLLASRPGVRLLETAGKGAKAGRIIAWSRQRGALLLIASRFMIAFRTLIPIFGVSANAAVASGTPLKTRLLSYLDVSDPLPRRTRAKTIESRSSACFAGFIRLKVSSVRA